MHHDAKFNWLITTEQNFGVKKLRICQVINGIVTSSRCGLCCFECRAFGWARLLTGRRHRQRLLTHTSPAFWIPAASWMPTRQIVPSTRGSSLGGESKRFIGTTGLLDPGPFLTRILIVSTTVDSSHLSPILPSHPPCGLTTRGLDAKHG